MKITFSILRVTLTFLLLLFHIIAAAQNKYGNTMVLGINGLVASFSDTSRPEVRKTSSVIMPGDGFINELSNICDSATGKPMFYFTGKKVYDTLGNIMDNGGNLLDSIVYYNSNFIFERFTQGSLILPKGNNQYYAFATTLSDSMFQNCWFSACPGGDYYDDLRYHVVDMNLNLGLGKVLTKNNILLNHVPINRSQMMACRHANGKDWWLLKTGYDTNVIYSFKITSDSIYGPQVQHISYTFSSKSDHLGQISFGKNGTKYAAVLGGNNILLVADFDRCTGLISNERYYHIPIDSTTILTAPNLLYDSLTSGVAFSPNGQFVYISRQYNIYQFQYDEEDSSLAWYRVKHGPDTTLNQFIQYGQLSNGPDGRIYIGKFVSGRISNVIDHPNIKGMGCNWCNRCFRGDTNSNWVPHSSFSNMPDYLLGPTGNPNCWPTSVPTTHIIPDDELMVYPNPMNEEFTLYFKSKDEGWFKMYNSLGELVFEHTITKDKTEHHMSLPYVLPNGLYSFQCLYSKNGDVRVGKVTVLR